jgi:hypothetical protein
MGSFVSYPTYDGDFDKRNDILRYRVTNQHHKIIWTGSSRSEAFQQLSECLHDLARSCENSKHSYGIISISRFYGELIPESKKVHPDNYTYNFDSYNITFSKSDDLGFNCVSSVRAYRGVKDKHPVHKDFYERKHLIFSTAASETLKLLMSKNF